ncbi:flagellin [Robertmurraya massiliosenegalensis]|uniref:flagellin n=1 Tax=Robertmurraya massiliosenegalensis TaxID=1287657 RepID=UPI00031C4CDC|nr:flagellin [Robertmurraya massiliosenegalensis]
MKINNQSMVSFSVNRYQKNETKIQKSLDHLSTGLSIGKANANASGVAVSEKMRAQIRGIEQAQRNMQDGYSALEVADSGLNHVNSLLQRAKELSVLSANDTLNNEDREKAQVELDELLQGINDTANKMEFNTKAILGERIPLLIMVGANPGQHIKIDLVRTSTTELGLDSASLKTQEDANTLISKIDDAITKIADHLTTIGAHQKSIEHHLDNAEVYANNLTKSFSMLTDADMAKEYLNFSVANIRQKGDEMLIKHVNQNAHDVLKILNV